MATIPKVSAKAATNLLASVDVIDVRVRWRGPTLAAPGAASRPRPLDSDVFVGRFRDASHRCRIAARNAASGTLASRRRTSRFRSMFSDDFCDQTTIAVTGAGLAL
jgi:hypothetical protein